MGLHKLVMGRHEDRKTWIAALITCGAIELATFLWMMYCMIYVNPIMLSLALGWGGFFVGGGYAGIGLGKQIFDSYMGD